MREEREGEGGRREKGRWEGGEEGEKEEGETEYLRVGEKVV